MVDVHSEKDRLLSSIKGLDATADFVGLDSEGRAHRYELKNSLLGLLKQEEVYL